MRYTNFGNTGLLVSKMAFGAMTFGQGTLVGELVNKATGSDLHILQNGYFCQICRSDPVCFFLNLEPCPKSSML